MSIRIGRAVVLPLFLVASAAGCTHEASVPRPLAAARAEVARAENGPARHLQPVAVADAEAALAAAEAAYETGDDLAELHAIYAQRNVLLVVRAAEARVIAERIGEARPTIGATEMQKQNAPAPTKKRAPKSTPRGGPQSGAPPKAR